MLRHLIALLAIVTLVLPAHVHASDDDRPLRVLMTVGGVGYHTSIVRNLQANEGLEVAVRDVDDDGLVFTSDALEDVDAVLMYHRDNVAEPEEREALLGFLENGGGVVVLHHAIANYLEWETWWRDHVGGLYVFQGHEALEPSRYFYGFSGVAVPTGPHPITQRIGSRWPYADESYERLWVSPDVTVLLRTNAVGSDESLAWIGPSESERVVFIQPGHFERVLSDATYLMLLEDALRWAARKPE